MQMIKVLEATSLRTRKIQILDLKQLVQTVVFRRHVRKLERRPARRGRNQQAVRAGRTCMAKSVMST
jgi:hypothetical protein